MFHPILPKLTEIRVLNRSNLLFCLDATAINPRPANHNNPRLKLSQVIAATHMRGVRPPANEKRASLLQLLPNCSSCSSGFLNPNQISGRHLSIASRVTFSFLAKREERS